MIEKSKYDRTELFFKIAKEMMHKSKMHEDTEITPDNVYQIAHKENRDKLKEIISIGHLPGSTILGVENVLKLNELAAQGKSCLILSEHLSNMDVPSLFTRFYEHENENLKDIFEKFIFIAGTKLNQNTLVKLYTEMFTRVVIYAIRSKAKLADDESMKAELDLAKKINIRATRMVRELRNKGNIFVLYPAGTRYRPWNQDTKKGLPMAFSYMNSFDYFVCCSINGNNMPPKEHEDMTREHFIQDVVTFNFGEVKSTKEFIEEHSANAQAEDKEAVRQHVVDEVMNEIDLLHEKAEEYRKDYVE